MLNNVHPVPSSWFFSGLSARLHPVPHPAFLRLCQILVGVGVSFRRLFLVAVGFRRGDDFGRGGSFRLFRLVFRQRLGAFFGKFD